jgi:hypothetical protein
LALLCGLSQLCYLALEGAHRVGNYKKNASTKLALSY